MLVSTRTMQKYPPAPAIAQESLDKIAKLFPYRFKVTPQNMELLLKSRLRPDPVIGYYISWARWHTDGNVPWDTFYEIRSLARHMRRHFDFGDEAEIAITCFCLGEFAEIYDDYMTRIQSTE